MKQTQFQIEQDWGNSCKAWEYFRISSSASEEEIIKTAIEIIKEDWVKQNQLNWFVAPIPCRPTIKIRQYEDCKRVKNGIKLTAKWR